MLLLFAADMHAIDVDHDPFPIHVIMLLGGLASLFYDLLEIVIGEFLFEGLEDIESEKRESALVQHEIMRVFGIFPRFIGYLDQILMEHVL